MNREWLIALVIVWNRSLGAGEIEFVPKEADRRILYKTAQKIRNFSTGLKHMYTYSTGICKPGCKISKKFARCVRKKNYFCLPFYKIHCTFVLTYKINKFLYFCFVQNYIVLIQKIMRNFFSLVVSHLLNAFCFCLLKIWHF